MAAQEGLGRLFDLSTGVVPVDLQTAQTGKRVSLKGAGAVTVVLFKAIGTAGDDPTVTLQQHTAASGGTSGNLAVIDHYWYKASTSALAGTEKWTRVDQTAAATIADPGGAGTSAESAMLVAFEVMATSLSDGYAYISLSVADTGSNAQLGSVLYILHDLEVQRRPTNLAAPLS